MAQKLYLQSLFETIFGTTPPTTNEADIECLPESNTQAIPNSQATLTLKQSNNKSWQSNTRHNSYTKTKSRQSSLFSTADHTESCAIQIIPTVQSKDTTNLKSLSPEPVILNPIKLFSWPEQNKLIPI
ncbi:19112_t:CDS:1 [Gigaspora margarita]|uniref:19112_t:CDS:1 n=1 Tax=Gigaspora margarita TaxID=4874 RepID=A0ABN7UH49_GIGMA|nr:19112_t:CDS:1 [Gigaspora margarita]